MPEILVSVLTILVFGLASASNEGASSNATGDLDAKFGSGGTVTTVFSTGSVISDVAIQPDGKIVAYRYSIGANQDFLLARYNADGTAEFTFGTGKVITDFGFANDV